MHVLPRRLLTFVLAASVSLLVLSGAPAGAINDRGAADSTVAVDTLPLLPFVGTAEIGCTRGSGGPVCGGHHSYDAIDFLMPNGTPLISPVDGVIVGVDGSCSNTPFACSGYGNFLHIAALDGSASYVLAHLSEVVVAEGMVRAGELVGYSGESGRASTPHLHFEEHANTEKELGGDRHEPSAYLGCVNSIVGTTYPTDRGFGSWYDVPAHAGVEVVNWCFVDPEWLESEPATLDGVTETPMSEIPGLEFDTGQIRADDV